jgi:hypothetical protein
MRSFYLLLLVSVALTAFSCQSDNQKANQSTEGVQQAAPVQPQQNATTTPVQINPGSAGYEPHYKCPNSCEGGVGASKGACPVCGTEMAHNQAFHNNPSAQQQSSPNLTPPANVQSQQQASPAQNDAGVYHYTCPSGCSGGAGAAGPCASCGAVLVHNQAYHN